MTTEVLSELIQTIENQNRLIEELALKVTEQADFIEALLEN